MSARVYRGGLHGPRTYPDDRTRPPSGQIPGKAYKGIKTTTIFGCFRVQACGVLTVRRLCPCKPACESAQKSPAGSSFLPGLQRHQVS